MPRSGSTGAAAENPPASANHGRSRSRSISMTRSSGRRRSPGARARSGCAAYRISPSTSGSSPIISRRHWRLHFWLHNNLDSGAFRGAQAQWDKITVPMFSVGNWSGMGLHLRGNTEAFMRAATAHKKLRIHAGTHVHPFYSEDGRRDQLRFFDYWLKGIDNGVMAEPPVKLAIRKGRDEVEWRFEHEWPLARTRWTRFYFDLSQPAPGTAANAGRLVAANPQTCSSRTYPATSLGSMGSTSAASSQVMAGAIP